MGERFGVKRLSAAAAKAANAPGRYGDGDGLYLLVGPTGALSWVCRVQKDGRRRDIGLGSAKKVTLAQARERPGAVIAEVEGPARAMTRTWYSAPRCKYSDGSCFSVA